MDEPNSPPIQKGRRDTTCRNHSCGDSHSFLPIPIDLGIHVAEGESHALVIRDVALSKLRKYDQKIENAWLIEMPSPFLTKLVANDIEVTDDALREAGGIKAFLNSKGNPVLELQKYRVVRRYLWPAIGANAALIAGLFVYDKALFTGSALTLLYTLLGGLLAQACFRKCKVVIHGSI
ncbi:hypothetical protein DFJ77DRAFT_509351 [Powellomyces hirtus]|nr:hypothetical protein DFJ77DRAFT_509351 [Powellomyces hirtus]